jgi:hypothetical protein
VIGGRINRICRNCGTEFFVFQSAIKKGRGYFCSRNCYHQWNKGENSPRFKKELKVIQICIQCKKEFVVAKGRVDDGRGKFCSRRCKGDWMSINRSGENHPMWNGGKKMCICKRCGKEFLITPSIIGNEKNNGSFCSKVCLAKSKTGKRGANWQGGLSFYPYCEKFNEDFRDRVRAFDGYACVECEMTQEEHLKRYKRKLLVHHVAYDKQVCCNSERPLFVALCCSCSSKANGKREYWKQHYTDLIMDKYRGKCYFSKEEYRDLMMGV